MIDEGMWNRLLEQREKLLAKVKRLREENEILREELKNDDTGIKAIDGLLKAVGDRNEEVKRLRMMEKYHQQALKNAKQLMKDAVREAINTRHSHKCPTCDELDIWFEPFVTEEDVKQFFIDRQNPKSIYYVGEKN